MPFEISQEARDRAYCLFRRGVEYQMAAKSGQKECIAPARVLLLSVMEWVTPDTWFQLWWEIKQILSDLSSLSVSEAQL